MKRFANSAPEPVTDAGTSAASAAVPTSPASPASPKAPPRLLRFASSVSDLVKRIRSAHPEIAPRDPWKERHVGSTFNLKLSRAHAKHDALRPRASRVLQEAEELKAAAPSLKSASELQDILEGLHAWADAKEGTVQPPVHFRDRFAARLVDLKLRPEALLKQWDANGDGKLSPVEFRTQVRLLGFTAEQVSVFEIDELFRDFDSDGSMFLKLHELRKVLQSIEDGVRLHRRREQRAAEAAARLREAASIMGLAIKRTAALDVECDKLDRHARGELMTLEQRLGRQMALRNFKLHDVGIAWAERLTFKQSVLGLNGVATADDDAALDSLFTSFDTNCSGKLGISQLKKALVRLQRAAAVAVADHADQVVVVREVRSEVLKVQARAEKACAELRDLLVGKDELLAESFSRQSVGATPSTPSASPPAPRRLPRGSTPPDGVNERGSKDAKGDRRVARAPVRARGPSLVQPPWRNVNTARARSFKMRV